MVDMCQETTMKAAWWAAFTCTWSRGCLVRCVPARLRGLSPPLSRPEQGCRQSGCRDSVLGGGHTRSTSSRCLRSTPFHFCPSDLAFLFSAVSRQRPSGLQQQTKAKHYGGGQDGTRIDVSVQGPTTVHHFFDLHKYVSLYKEYAVRVGETGAAETTSRRFEEKGWQSWAGFCTKD